MPAHLLACIVFAVTLASCGQLAPGSGQGACNTNTPHECCQTITPSPGYSCEQDNGPATCRLSGWTCPGLGFLADECNGGCTPSPPLAGNPERDAETDATTIGDDTADDETDAAPGDAAEDYACIQGGPCSRESSGCVLDGGDASYSCSCVGDFYVSPRLECFDCHQGAPCGVEYSCGINDPDSGGSILNCTCEDGSFDCVDGGDGG
jgi:hypothetical protein